MIRARSLVFVAWLYLTMAVYAVVLSPALLMSHGRAMWVIKAWARAVLWGLHAIARVEVQVTGDVPPAGRPALVASKHQGMLDVVALLAILPDPCFVLKKELMILPFFGWFAAKARMIAVDRAGHARALKDMARQAADRLAEGRQIVIFPEGTRTAPGEPGVYKPGVAAMYRDFGVDCWPVATDSGVYWPAHGIDRRPGTASFAFLEPIPSGMKRGPFMALLESRIETASSALLEPKAGTAHLR